MAALFRPPKKPAVQPPAPMPDINDPAVREAGRRQQQDALASSGRGSTILTEEEDRGPYTRRSLGGR